MVLLVRIAVVVVRVELYCVIVVLIIIIFITIIAITFAIAIVTLTIAICKPSQATDFEPAACRQVAPNTAARAMSPKGAKRPVAKPTCSKVHINEKQRTFTKEWRSDYPAMFEGVAYKWQLTKIVFNEKKGTAKEFWKWRKLQ